MEAKRLGALLGITLLTLAALPAPVLAAPSGLDPDIIDVGPRLRVPGAVGLSYDSLPAADAAGSGGQGEGLAYMEGDVVWGLVLNDYTGYYQSAQYFVAAVGETAEVWVSLDFQFPEGDPRNPVVLTWEQIDYVLAEFEETIYPSDTAFFGTPDYHDGSQALLPGYWGLPEDYYMAADGKDRVIIMVSNIRDDHFYDPDYPVMIAGFYSGQYEAYFDRNVISIDAYAWADRLGPDAARPYLYEGVVAHELQHLIHDDVDADEDLWFNEGCADFAQFVCGYGHPMGHIGGPAGALNLPENSLVAWGDQGDLEILSDYGHAYLFVLYLFEQFGYAFVRAAVANPADGMAGINATIAGGYRVDRSFAQLYHDWSVALLIDSKTPGGGRYEFQTIDLHVNAGSPDDPNEQAFATPGAPPWGTDYVWLEGTGDPAQTLAFDGADFFARPTPWVSTGAYLYSGSGDMLDNWAIFEAPGGGTLTFNTWYDIEDYWDFGFVQVSTDGGLTWTSLANAYTVDVCDPSAIGTVAENLPGLTGWSGGWIPLSFDLSAYAGQDILIAFRYVTDWAVAFTGWAVDNVRIDGVLISDGSSTAPFHDISEYLPTETDFLVTVVRAMPGAKGLTYQVKDMNLADATETGTLPIGEWFADGWTHALMLVTFAAPQDFTEYVPYEYGYSTAD